ncbi:MAG TPA: class I SAM-dependent methyltransferase [Burkholderiales bacterium]|nr:class I SAM-dependent methyltransferase [Burkholderiales bacterium]
MVDSAIIPLRACARPSVPPGLAPYDLIAEKWSRGRKLLRRERPYVDRFIALASPGGHILDVGCGSGSPIARHLLDRGYRVTGVDGSLEMLRLARTNCPEAELIHKEMTEFDPPDRYEGIVAWDSLFHVPRVHHGPLFQSFHRWLAPGAPLLVSVGGSETEFTDQMFGVDFFYSAHAPDATVALLREAGFEILVAEIDDPSSRGHFAVVCRKAAHSAETAGGTGQLGESE